MGIMRTGGDCIKGPSDPAPGALLTGICRNVSSSPCSRHITGGCISNAVAVGKRRILPGDAVLAARQSSAIRNWGGMITAEFQQIFTGVFLCR